MTIWILDTDHYSLLERGNSNVTRRISTIEAKLIFLTIISAEEQIRGRLNIIRRASSSEEVIIAYRRLRTLLDDLKNINLLDFSMEAAIIYNNLVRQKIRIGTRDLRIAAIALSVKGIVVTRNRRDFEKVPGLALQDWTVE
ncbi:type II toxin-antitoxin system VapC family toxin [Spirulina sp. 06S082]|uniref:type II toxin-antitoxin system VapC family toxin n=1 Tax=Spirulina sp. 06S082 TaxID=3110248 RepID=UPI002B20AFAB|nr:type II toxin-antitoxin system VapC family toxin [Spirulina sp. 06S082]MEA5468376.1 type II toxin-antitoxin system VapC family toxin [Spirulina sp. 06S082]